MRYEPEDLVESWGLLIPDDPQIKETSANDNNNRLWVGLLKKVPYEEVQGKGYQRKPVHPGIHTIDVIFDIKHKTTVRGVALWMDSEGGNPIYWRRVEPRVVSPHMTFELSLTLKDEEGEPYRPSGLMRALGVA